MAGGLFNKPYLCSSHKSGSWGSCCFFRLEVPIFPTNEQQPVQVRTCLACVWFCFTSFFSSFLFLRPTSGCISLLCATETLCEFPYIDEILQPRQKCWASHYPRTEVMRYRDSMSLSSWSDSVFSISHILAEHWSFCGGWDSPILPVNLFYLLWHT